MSKRPGPDTAEEDFATSGAWQFEQQTWGVSGDFYEICMGISMMISRGL